MKKMIPFLVVFIIAVVFVFSCKKDDVDNIQSQYGQQLTVSKDYAFAQWVYAEAFQLVTQGLNNPTLMGGTSTTIGGAQVTYSAALAQMQFVWTSKSSGRSGGFTAQMNDKDLSDSLFSCTVNYNNYMVDGTKIEGTNVYENEGSYSDSKGLGLKFKFQFLNARIIKATDTVTFNANMNILWKDGLLTLMNPADDVFYIWGAVNGSSSITGNSYQVAVNNTNKLKLANCQWVVGGEVDMVLNTKDSATQQPVVTNALIDFINSDNCNNQVRLVINGLEYSFPMSGQ